jgi:hypothetical protein
MTQELALERSLRRALAFAHAALEDGRPESARSAVVEALRELSRIESLSLTLGGARRISALVARLRGVMEALANARSKQSRVDLSS